MTRDKVVLLVALLTGAAMCAYPPFFAEHEGRRIFRGYHFFFDTPILLDQIDLQRLLVQLTFLAIATAFVLVFIRKKER